MVTLTILLFVLMIYGFVATLLVGILYNKKLRIADNTSRFASRFWQENPIVYADYNASTPMLPESIDAFIRASHYGFSNASSLHKGGILSRFMIEKEREKIAHLLQCHPRELFFTSGATESNNMAIKGFLMHLPPGAYSIVTTPIEHASVSQVVDHLYHFGQPAYSFKVEKVRVDARGHIDIEHFNALCQDPECVLAAVIIGNNEIGTIQDVATLGQITRQNNVHFHGDMTQMCGKYTVHLSDENSPYFHLDSMTMSAHKFHGPKGVGCLYVSRKTPFDHKPLWIEGGSQEQGWRGGTENIAGICSMSTALEICQKRFIEQEKRSREIERMRNALWTHFQAYISPTPRLFGDLTPGKGLYNTLCMALPVNSRSLIPLLDQKGVLVNTGCACSKGEASKVLGALGASIKEMEGSMRISLGWTSTWSDVQKLKKEITAGVCFMQIHKQQTTSEEAEAEASDDVSLGMCVDDEAHT